MFGTLAIWALLFCFFAPILIWAFKALGVVSPRSSDFALAVVLVVAGVSFLALAWLIFKETGYIFNPGKHGPNTVPPDADSFSKLMAIAMSLLLGGMAIFGGIATAVHAAKQP